MSTQIVEPDHEVKRKTRIQCRNEQRILDAAEEVFGEFGFGGATIDIIADRAFLSKPNLHYYYKTKKILYAAVLGRVLERWVEPLSTLDPDGDPATEIARYMARKLELTRLHPTASRVFANEILHGATELDKYLRTDLKEMVDAKAKVIRGWSKAGRLIDVDPHHLLFLIWAATQHYADFLPQVLALLDVRRLGKAQFKAVEASLGAIVLNGILPRVPAPKRRVQPGP